MRRSREIRSSMEGGGLSKDHSKLDPSEGSELLCLFEIPEGPHGVRQNIRIMKLKGISFQYKTTTEGAMRALSSREHNRLD